MDASTDGPVLPGESSWVPSTPAKPSLTNSNPICPAGQENEVVCGNWLGSQIISRGNKKGSGSELGIEKLQGRFLEEPHAGNVSASCVTDYVNISSDFDGLEAAIGAKPQLYGTNAAIYNKLPMVDDKWNGSFGNLLALAHAAAEETAYTTSSYNAIFDSQIEGSNLQKLLANSPLRNPDILHATKCWTSCDQVSEISNNGTSIPCKPPFDLNSPPRTMSDLASRESIQSHFAPITPDQATRAYKEQVANLPSVSIMEMRDVQEGGLTVRDVELNKLLHKYEQSQVLVDQSSAGISTELQENHAPDKGGSQGDDLNKTPQQKPRRKKHRPKVIIEGQPKRTPKPRTPKPTAPEGIVPGKRRYVRRNTGSKVTATPKEKGTDGIASTTTTPDSEEKPRKRKYVRRKGMQQHADIPLEDGISRTDQMIGQQTKPSCRRSLNFDSESQVRDDRSSGLSSNFDNETNAKNISAEDHSSLNAPLKHRKESRIRKTEVGISSDLYCSMSQKLKHYTTIPERQVSAPSTSPKNHQLHDKSMRGHENECTRGKCQIVFSNATHDKEVNVVQMMLTTDAYCLKSPSSSNCSSSACLTEETQARGSKRHHLYMTEAEFCSTNVTGAHYNSLNTYLPIISQNESKSNCSPRFHFPGIQKKRRTEKVYRSATCRAESAVTFATENCSTNNQLPFTDSCENLFISDSIHGISATHSDSSGAPTRHAILHCGVQEKLYINCLLGVGNNQKLTKKRSKAPTRARASLWETCEQLFTTPNGEPTKIQRVVDQTHGCMESIVQNHAIVTRKKRSKRNSSVAPPLAITWKAMSPIDEMIEHFCLLDINAQNSRLGCHEQNALISYQRNYPEQNALVVYQRDGTIIPFNDSYVPSRKRKPRPKVDLDDETSRVWKLLLEDINSEGIDGTDEEKAKWWEEERKVFRGRTDSFIARMHLVQGDRRFTPWKGSVLDSVIGVFLTQNVSDHLSSSAFMSLAAQYPLKSNGKHKESHDEQTCITTEKPEVHVLDPDDAIAWHEKSNHSTSGKGSITKQYMELNEENVSTSSEAFQSSSYGIKSTDNSTGQLIDSFKHNLNVNHGPAVNGPAMKISQPLASSAGDQTESDDILSSQNSVDSSVAQTENFESCSLSTFERETTVETKTNHFSVSTSFIELLHGVCSQGSVNGPLSMYGSCQSECDVCITESTDWSNDAEAFPSNITSCSNSGLHVIRNSGAQEGSRCSHKELCATEDSVLSAESANQTTLKRTRAVTFEEVPKSTCQTENSTNNHQIEVNLNILGDPEKNVESQIHQQEDNHKMYQPLDSPTLLLSTSEVTEKTIITDNPRDHREKPDQSSLNACFDHLGNTINPENPSRSKGKTRMSGKQKQKVVDWDCLRKEVQTNGKKRERTADTMDSLDWEAVRCADVKEIAETIKARGMNNMLAERIKDLLNRLMREHGSIDLEWLRDVPPDKAKEYLLSIRGLGLKSVECVRLLTLHHLAFPVDTNVGRIAVRLGWVPLQPLPESLQLHLLELYPILESIQKYLWPRLCKLDQRTLYELHYQMITFGKVFCTKSKPNCNACPMRGECRHFASAFASARLALPAPEEKSIVIATENQAADQNSVGVCSSSKLCLPPADRQNLVGICSSSNLCLPQANEELRAHSETSSSDPIVVVPATPEPAVEEPGTPEPDQAQVSEPDIEEFEDPDEIPIIKLNMEEFTQNLQMFVGNSAELQEHEMSKALVALTAEAASIPMPKLKNINRLRTEHHVYELPDSHPLLQELEQREPDDPCPYLLAIWTPGETANSVQPPERTCNSKELGILCDEETCFSCNSIREANSQTVRGTLLIPCRTAMRGSFPLNGTYFQVNEVFADHESSLNPIDVPRAWIWNLPRRTVYFGTSVPSIFRGLSTEEIQYCFWRGFVCVRGFEQKTRAPRPLMARLHFPASKTKTRGSVDENEN